MTLSLRGREYGALQLKLFAILTAEDRVFKTYCLVANAFDVKTDENGFRRISTALMSTARRALHGLVRDGAVIDLGRHYPNTRRHWCSKRAELLHEIQRKREAIEALIRRGQVDEVARLSRQMAPLFEDARTVGIEPYAEAMKPKKPKVSAASRGDPAGPVGTSGLVFSPDREPVAARHPNGRAGARERTGLSSGRVLLRQADSNVACNVEHAAPSTMRSCSPPCLPGIWRLDAVRLRNFRRARSADSSHTAVIITG